MKYYFMEEMKKTYSTRKINENGEKAKYIVADLNNEEDLKLLCGKAKQENIKILINNAGIICPGLPLKDFSYEKIESMIKVNLIAPIKIINNLYFRSRYQYKFHGWHGAKKIVAFMLLLNGD